MNLKQTIPLAHWSLFRSQLRWAYDRLLVESGPKAWPYVIYPAAAWLIRSGSVTLRFASGSEQFGPGSWIFPREEEGMQEFSSGTRIISLRFQAEWSYGTPLFDRSKTVVLPQKDTRELTACAEALVAHVQEQFPGILLSQEMEGGFDQYLGLQPVFMRWIAAYYAALSAHGVPVNTLEQLDDKVRLALQIIETQSLAVPFRESELARASGCSVSQLNKLFAAQTGSTPASLWNRRKLGAAKSQLLNSNESIKAIAYHFGFSAPEHFTHWFKKNSDHSPLEFRRLQRAGAPFPL